MGAVFKLICSEAVTNCECAIPILLLLLPLPPLPLVEQEVPVSGPLVCAAHVW
jgi:hypothetical protein